MPDGRREATPPGAVPLAASRHPCVAVRPSFPSRCRGIAPTDEASADLFAENPIVRSRIAAPANATLLYAGNFFRPVWQEPEPLTRTQADRAAKRILPDVLAAIATPGQPRPNLLLWAKALDGLPPWNDNGIVAWRALSGIDAANAAGAVSFCNAAGIARSDKVFAATELPVRARNPQVDAVTKDVLADDQRCIQQGQAAVNLGSIAA